MFEYTEIIKSDIIRKIVFIVLQNSDIGMVDTHLE